ncbi:cytidylyltransferase family protein [Ophiostoma piceae UAMH 11346]|uniref:Cytidylyltransferase family protein n=1 Tax=Ophiostoma piceae (strain UAMH 11346) TaxID=1262450 RepID=S3BYR1_OPHP1|nr:cytidylyltransferase family protein [Ophiostoma piceae UAMH 11346]
MTKTMAAPETTYFKKALTSFVKSAAKFDVVCSVRGSSTAASPLVHPSRPRSQIHTLVVLDSSFNPPTVAHMQMATSAIQELQRHHLSSSPYPISMRLLLLLSVNNADKASKTAAFEQRLALMLAMAKDVQAVFKDTLATPPASTLDVPIDIGLTSEPYFHSKSAAIAESSFYLRPDFASAPDSKPTPEQVFLVGYDTLIRIFHPKYYKAPEPPASIPHGLPEHATPMQIALTPLMRRARLRVTTRPDDQWGNEEVQHSWLQTIDERGGATENWSSRIDLMSGTYKGASIVSSTTARTAAKEEEWEKLAEQVGPSVAAWIKLQQLYVDA